MEYDFAKLNDREFEALGASIISKILNKRIEIFKAGRDEGVDGRFWIGNNKEGIIQCKHYVETPYNKLISKLKSEEAPKVNKLKPTKYIFITSQKLSRKNKQEIIKIFHPYIQRGDDVFGKEDLNTFLSKKENQDVVEQNLKLWFTSTAVLDIIYNNAIKGRSECTIREIEEKAHKYAITSNHERGVKILQESNVVILTGEPGIGKTTLADNLALFYSAKGYEFCDIEDNISEAESIFREKEKKKILFYCDDFLGSNMYDAINNKRDSHIGKFINRIRKDNSKKFILTSRTNILNKAISLSHIFQNRKIRDNEFLLKVENLSNLDKAQILYNHIYHSHLDRDYLDKIYDGKRYREIIDHRNFNPRIIEFITDKARVGHVPPDKYWEYVKKNLEEPEEIWANYFQNQTDDCVRALTFLTVFNNGKISEDVLRNSYGNFLKIHNVNLGDNTDKSFEAVRKLAVKSLLSRNQIDDINCEYVLFNPSITDFVISSYSNEIELISNILISLETDISVNFLNILIHSNKIDKKCSESIQENIFDHLFYQKMKEENWDFLILISYINLFNEKVNSRIEQFINTLHNADCPCGTNLFELLAILTDFEPKIKLKKFEFLYNFIDDINDETTLKSLLTFIEKFNINDTYIDHQVYYHIEMYLKDMINSSDFDINFGDYVNQSSDVEGNTEYDIDVTGLKGQMFEILDSCLENFNGSVLKRIKIDISTIVSEFNLEDMAINYFESIYYDDDEIERGFSDLSSSHDDIDAVFERF